MNQLRIMTILLGLVAIFAAQSLSAQNIKLQSGGASGGNIIEVASFSIKATDSIEVKRVSADFWTNNQTNTSVTVHVFYKPGAVLTAASSGAGWTKAITWSGIPNPRYSGRFEIPMDINVLVPANTEMSFAIAGDNAPNRTVHTSFSPTTFSNATAEMDCLGRQGSFTPPSTLSFSTTSTIGFRGAVSYVLAGDDIDWVGNVSSNWNTAANWSTNAVPTDADFVTIPDASTTNNDPVLPSNAKVRDLEIESGGVLDGATGSLELRGKWDNKGTFTKGTSTLTFNGATDQEINDAANDFHILTISGKRATLSSAVTAGHSGTWIVNAGAELAFFGGNAVDLTGISLTNNGSLVFGGSGNTQTITTLAAHDLKDVIVDVPGASDTVTFTGTQEFDSLSLTGNGRVTFPGDVEFASSFETDMGSTGSLTCGTLTGTGDITLSQSHTLNVAHSIGTNTIIFDGSGTTTLTGNHSGDLEHSGNGSLTLNGSLSSGSIEYLGSGACTITGDFNGSDLTHDGSGSLTIEGDFTQGDIYLDATGNVTIEGESTIGAIEMTGGTVFTADMSAEADSLVQEGTGQLNFDGGLTLNDDMTLEPDQGLGTVNIDGALLVDGDLTINPAIQGSINSLFVSGTATIKGKGDFLQSNARFEGPASFDGDVAITKEAKVNFADNTSTITLTKLTLSGTGELLGDAKIVVEGLVTMSNSSKINVDGDFTAQFHVNNQSTEKILVAGRFTLDGSAAAVTLNLNLSDDIEAGTILIDASNGAKLTGTIQSDDSTMVAPGITVSAGTTLELADEAELVVGNGFLAMNGKLVTTAGATGLPAKIVGDNAPADQGTVIFGATSEIDVSGLIFERIGNSGEDFAIVFNNNSKITKFDFVRIPDSASTVAVIDLNTSDVVADIDGLLLGGTSPINIDAFDSFDITITITMGTTGGGSLYGASKEQDPQKILFWDASPVVLIQSPAQLPLAYVGRAYSYQIPVTGGNAPYAYSLANHPAWMSVNALTGEITGTPAAGDIAAGVSFDIVVGDSTLIGMPPNTTPLAAVSKAALVDVEFPPYFPINITSDSNLADATGDVAYSAQIMIEEGRAPFLFELVGAQSWLSIDPSTGEITGTPPLLFEGPISFTVRVSDDNQATPAVSKLFNLTVQPSGYQAIVLTDDTDLPDLVEGDDYDFDLSITGGVAPYTYEFASAPTWANIVVQPGEEADDPANWLNIDPDTGKLSGTAPLGRYDDVLISIRVTDNRAGSPAAVKGFTLEVVEIPYTPITIISPALLPEAAQGQLYSYTIQASNGQGAYDFALGAAPVWISIDPVSGEVSGIPPSTFSGFLNFQVFVGDQKIGQPSVAKTFALKVERVGDDPLLVDTPPVLFAAEPGLRYEIVLAASGGSGDGYVWTLRPGHVMPEGLTLSIDGVISGTPLFNTPGDYIFDVSVKDDDDNESFQTLVITVKEPDVSGGGLDNTVQPGNLPDRGPSGGCAIGSGQNLWLLVLLGMLSGLMLFRVKRREA